MSDPSAAERSQSPTDRPPAVVLAAFGTTDEVALEAIIHIRDRVRAAFPDHEIHLAFTSRIVRRVWLRRAASAEYRRAHPEVPADIYHPFSPLSVLAALQEDGPRRVLVQSLHVADGAEYRDLKAVVRQLAGIRALHSSGRPFPALALGPPALGDGGEAQLTRAAEALGPLAAEARARGAALVLMGHGHERLQQTVFGRLKKKLRQRYSPEIYLGLVEGRPGLDDILGEMARSGKERKTAGGAMPGAVLLAPLMVVAGEHARRDLAGETPDSWASVFAARGWEVRVHLKGLGLDDAWADLYVDHLRALEAD